MQNTARTNLILRRNRSPLPRTSEPCGTKAFWMPSQPAECSSTTAPVVDAAELSPERLVEQCQAGSPEAFERLVEHYEKRIFNFLCQMTNNPHDAEDLAQETFLKAYHGIHRFDSAHGFSTW